MLKSVNGLRFKNYQLIKPLIKKTIFEIIISNIVKKMCSLSKNLFLNR